MLRTVMLDRSYIFKHWSATLIIAPFLLALWEMFRSEKNGWLDILGMYPLFLFFGLLFSLPALLFYCRLFVLLGKSNMEIAIRKLLLIGFAVLSIAITLWFVDGTLAPMLATAYSVAAIISGFLFKLQSDKEAMPATKDYENGG
jgi:phosphoglycerol transferase MdoB-like AlkP superfamily enzyme